jgi:hypothetical protein
MQSSPLPCYLIPLGPKYPPQLFIVCCTVKTKIEGRTVRTKKQIRKNTKREREKEFGITVEARFSAPVQTVPGTHPDSYKMGAGPVSPG